MQQWGERRVAFQEHAHWQHMQGNTFLAYATSFNTWKITRENKSTLGQSNLWLFQDSILYHLPWPWPRLRFTMSVESKFYLLHFLAQFSTDHNKISCGVGTVQLSILMLILSEIYEIKENNCFWSYYVKKQQQWQQFNVGMHSDVYEPICFKLGMMTATTQTCVWE